MRSVKTLEYMIQTVMHNNDVAHILFVDRGDDDTLLRNPDVEMIGTPGKQNYGFSLTFVRNDGVQIRIGSDQAPLPMELYELACSNEGLTVGFMNGEKLNGGQKLYIDKPAPAARPRPAG